MNKNFIQLDCMCSREHLLPRLNAFASANFIAFRIWGGGHPMPDTFYDLADEMGLLLWHEFPYACAGYPVTPGSLADAAAETTDIVQTIGSHPSIFMWGGNNEIAQVALCTMLWGAVRYNYAITLEY